MLSVTRHRSAGPACWLVGTIHSLRCPPFVFDTVKVACSGSEALDAAAAAAATFP